MQLIKRMKVTQVDDGIYMLLNGMTGALDLIDEEVYQLYLQWRASPPVSAADNPEMYANFLSRGYLMEPEAEDAKMAEIYRHLEAGLQATRPRVDPTFLLTYNCNFRCPYCYEKHLQEKGKDYLIRRMSPEMIDGFFASFDEQQMTIGEITLYGGEPLLPANTETIQAILKHAIARDLPVKVVTNGYTLDQFAPLLQTANTKMIQVTIDGDRERHNQSRFLASGEGTFDQIVAGLVKAKNCGLPVVLRCNMEIDEEGQVERLLSSLEGTGLKEYPGFQLYIAPVASAESKYKCTHEFLSEYLKKVDQYLDSPLIMNSMLRSIHNVAVTFLDPKKWRPTYVYCGAHVGQQIFDPWGHIYPCQILAGDESQSIGTFDEAGHITYTGNYQTWQNRTVQNLASCKDCAVALFCGGGCAMRSIKTTGDICSHNCEGMDELFSTFLPFLYQRYLKNA